MASVGTAEINHNTGRGEEGDGERRFMEQRLLFNRAVEGC